MFVLQDSKFQCWVPLQSLWNWCVHSLPWSGCHAKPIAGAVNVLRSRIDMYIYIYIWPFFEMPKLCEQIAGLKAKPQKLFVFHWNWKNISPGLIVLFRQNHSLIFKEYKFTLFGWVYPFFSIVARDEFKDQKQFWTVEHLLLLNVIQRTVGLFDVRFNWYKCIASHFSKVLHALGHSNPFWGENQAGYTYRFWDLSQKHMSFEYFFKKCQGHPWI